MHRQRARLDEVQRALALALADGVVAGVHQARLQVERQRGPLRGIERAGQRVVGAALAHRLDQAAQGVGAVDRLVNFHRSLPAVSF